MPPADRIQAVFDDFKAGLGRSPTDHELILNLADRLDRAEAGKCRGFLRLPPLVPSRPAKPPPPEPSR